MQHFTQAEFEAIVDEALDSIPERFAQLIENVSIAIEDEPNADDLDALEDDPDADPDGELLGIYRGVPLTERSAYDTILLPDEIAIFRGPICRVARSRREAIEEIRETVVHELGHYFGLEDDELP